MAFYSYKNVTKIMKLIPQPSPKLRKYLYVKYGINRSLFLACYVRQMEVNGMKYM